MNIQNNHTNLSMKPKIKPAAEQAAPVDSSEEETSVWKGIAGGVAGAVIDSIGLTGTTLLQTVPFQMKAQTDLWTSEEHGFGYQAAWSAGLVAINAAAIALTPLIGAGVGAYYGYNTGSTEGVAAAAEESVETVKFVNTFISDTVRDDARTEESGTSPSKETVKVQYVTQDPTVAEPVVGNFPKSMFGDNLSNSRIVMDDSDPLFEMPTAMAHPPTKPDPQGNFIHEPGTPEFQQVNSFLSSNLALDMFEESMGREIPWAFSGPLLVHPHAGEGFNAFYGRQFHSVNFFDGADTVNGNMVHGSESMDIVSHEVGHAILDALKPGMMTWFGGIEGPSFHESFGDIAAILTSLQDENMVDQVVAETQGDLKKPNAVARLAEEMSAGINHSKLGSSMPEDWAMRNANNDLKYQDPSTLPEKPDSIDDLFREPHSLSRVFTGGFWDIMSSVNNGLIEDGLSPKEALMKTTKSMTDLVGKTLELTPNRLKRMSQVTEAMLKADERYFDGQFHDDIETAMAGRNLLPEEASQDSVNPEIVMGKDMKDLKSADSWRAELGELLPGDGAPLKAEAFWKNDVGETFVRYTGVQEVDIDPETVTDLGASLTLAFEPSGELFHSQWDPVDDEAIELARDEVQYWRASGAIEDRFGATSLHEADSGSGHPTIGYTIPLEEPGMGLSAFPAKRKLVRLPVSH